MEQELVLDKLTSGDRPSIYAVGVVASEALKRSGMAVFMTDVIGRVHLVPNAAVQIHKKPRLTDEELDSLEESDAINLLMKQEDGEEEIVSYLRRRDVRRVKEAL